MVLPLTTLPSWYATKLSLLTIVYVKTPLAVRALREVACAEPLSTYVGP
jgi:hypothetical protein